MGWIPVLSRRAVCVSYLEMLAFLFLRTCTCYFFIRVFFIFSFFFLFSSFLLFFYYHLTSSFSSLSFFSIVFLFISFSSIIVDTRQAPTFHQFSFYPFLSEKKGEELHYFPYFFLLFQCNITVLSFSASISSPLSYT